MGTMIVSSKEFRLNFPKYQALVEQGISITIVKRSKPIFTIQPVDELFDEQITESLLDYEQKKAEQYVKYDDVFSATWKYGTHLSS